MKKLMMSLIAFCAIYVMNSQAPMAQGKQAKREKAKPAAEWKKVLSGNTYEIMVDRGTEPPYKNAYWNIDNGGNMLMFVPAGKNFSMNAADGARVGLTNKVAIANATTDLKTALDTLFTALTGWVNTGGTTPNAATVTAITAAKTLVDSLLT